MKINGNEISKETLSKAMLCDTPEELVKRAKENGVELTVKEAEAYAALQEGEVDAVVLPELYIAMGKADGMVLLADDASGASGANLSMSVLVSRAAFQETSGGERTLQQLREAWERAAMWIAYYPIPSRELLAETTGVSTSVTEGYELDRYPVDVRPTNAEIDPIIAWMTDKGYLTVGIIYDEAAGSLTPDVDEEAAS